jgi:selenocysteine lyase/cysteine desulfurase
VERNVQRGGRYRHSQQVDATIARARESVNVFLNARDPSEIAFGMNATYRVFSRLGYLHGLWVFVHRRGGE